MKILCTLNFFNSQNIRNIYKIKSISSRETCYLLYGMQGKTLVRIARIVYSSFHSNLAFLFLSFLSLKSFKCIFTLRSIAPLISISYWPDDNEDDDVHTQHSSINPNWLLSVCVYTQIAVCVCVRGSFIYLDIHIVLHL